MTALRPQIKPFFSLPRNPPPLSLSRNFHNLAIFFFSGLLEREEEELILLESWGDLCYSIFAFMYCIMCELQYAIVLLS